MKTKSNKLAVLLALLGTIPTLTTNAATPEAREHIAWYSTIESAQSEAKRTGKPIFLLAARPECRGVPGFW